MAGEVHVEESRSGLLVRPPDPVGPAVLYLHGDRYLGGSPEAALDMAGHLALRTGGTVVCARYRSAFPASLHDAHTAYLHAEALGPVAVAGEGSGAGLAAALMVHLRDSGAPLPRCATLVSGLLDLTLQAPSLLFNAGANPEFDLDRLRREVTRYADGAEPHDPLLSPLHANLHGLPPLQLLTAGTDPFLDDSLAFATRAARSSLVVDLHVHPDPAGLRAGLLREMTTFLKTWTSVETPPLPV
ncbi:alpha/beta hydrolase fold domain-containing protein [Actinocorallia sp. B10E7]|uniref:alpha/beta hydrolase fold domain-containing protein n=1 Tax=Actinocorallia sp. B10E7 TaxID=3153558 RepID=UPI00325C37D2